MPPAPGPPGLCDPGLGSVRADFGGGLPVGAPSAQSWSAGPLLLLVEEAAVSTPREQQSPLPSSKDPPTLHARWPCPCGSWLKMGACPSEQMLLK